MSDQFPRTAEDRTVMATYIELIDLAREIKFTNTILVDLHPDRGADSIEPVAAESKGALLGVHEIRVAGKLHASIRKFSRWRRLGWVTTHRGRP